MTDTNSNQDVNMQSHDGSSELTVLQEQLAACQVDVQGWKEKFLRVSADYQNYMRRSDKERAEWMQVAKTNVLKDLLPIVDDVERAVQDLRTKEQTADVTALLSGVGMINTAFVKVLSKYGIQEIVDTVVFNPELHEAVVSVESEQHKSGDIVTVFEKGYKVQDQVLRHAKVSVAK